MAHLATTDLRSFILSLLEESYPADQAAAVADAGRLLSGGWLHSLQILELLLFIEQKTGVRLSESDATTENLDGLETIERLIRTRSLEAFRAGE